MKLTARAIAELLAAHMVARDVACMLPEQFEQGAVYGAVDEQGQQLIKVFEAKRRDLLEAMASEFPEVLDAM